MKAFTDIEQSRMLAEILPLESADMTYRPIMDIDSMGNSGFLDIPDCYPFNEFKDCNIKPLPCWSLAALLKVIPKHIKDYNVFRIDIGDNDFSAWYDEIGFGVNSDLPNITMEEPIDVCYEMIIKLHELKML